MTPASGEAFDRLVAPFYAGPAHSDLPRRLFAMSSFEPEVARYFFGTLARPTTCAPAWARSTSPPWW